MDRAASTAERRRQTCPCETELVARRCAHAVAVVLDHEDDRQPVHDRLLIASKNSPCGSMRRRSCRGPRRFPPRELEPRPTDRGRHCEAVGVAADRCRAGDSEPWTGMRRPPDEDDAVAR